MDDSFLLQIFMAFLLMIKIASCQQSDFVDKRCNPTSNYTKNDAFSKNLNSLLNTMFDQTPKQEGFSKGSVGSVYGLSLCRGDVSSDYCDFCLYDARCKITQRCYNRTAIVWYDYCMMKYSDHKFFGKIDNENTALWYNVDNATDPIGFNKTVRELLGNLSTKAVKKSTLYAKGQKFTTGENATVYAMVQCTLDLSTKSCKKCLVEAIHELPGFTAETSTVGSRYIGGSCMARFEIYKFLED
ncbi:cysteine-rich repeat secretory protein [Striga asiatica]|uniref:Cysteine-rich repeat secretory protein n=1 Tax=Striga asiatica TaxID=4170 RepID=A0A5A7PGA5_STRAF|nr:cysteine-rich repeat secretory protein [Striga asiatica]